MDNTLPDQNETLGGPQHNAIILYLGSYSVTKAFKPGLVHATCDTDSPAPGLWYNLEVGIASHSLKYKW